MDTAIDDGLNEAAPTGPESPTGPSLACDERIAREIDEAQVRSARWHARRKTQRLWHGSRWFAKHNIVTDTIGNRRCRSVLAPRHIAPRQRGAGRPAGSRRAAARSRSSGDGDSSDPGDGEPAEGRHESSARVQP
jgi:hypothetical protein